MALPRDTPASSPPPSAFGRYRVVHQVGAGVLGPVFRGYDPEHDRAVSIKAFSLDLTPEQARDVAADLDRLSGLSLKHPSIIVPFAAAAEGSTPYLVEEYFVAESADVALKQYGPAPVPDAMRLIGQLAGALDFAAAAGVHHGALHPRDILVAPHEVRLSGLGVVEALERVGFHAPVRRPYAAPERAAGGAITTQADVFSIAGVSFELLTGRRPSLSGEAVTGETDAIPSADPAALAEVFARALSVRPGDRYPSALAFAAALKHALTGEPLLAGEATERPRARRAVRSASRKTPVPSESRTAAVRTEEPPADEHAGTVADVAGDELPLEPPVPEPVFEPADPESPVPEPLPAAPHPGSTPLPAFLESYRPTVAEPIEPETPVAPERVLNDFELLEGRGRDIQPLPDPDLDLADLDRKTARARAVEPVSDPAPAPEPAPEEFDMRVEPAAEVLAAPQAETTPTPEPEERSSSAQPARGPMRFEGEPPLVPPAEPQTKTSLVSLFGMLLVGILIGFAAGYMVAPKGGPEGGTPPAVTTPAAAQPLEPPATSGPVSAPPADATPQLPAPAGATSAGGAAASGMSAAPPTAEARAPARTPARATPNPAVPPRAKSQPARTTAATAGTAAKKPSATRAKGFEGSLVIASKPDGATAQLDGRPIGKTPLTLQAVSAGAHAIRLELNGYQVWSSSVQVTAGKVNRVTASLERRPGG